MLSVLVFLPLAGGLLAALLPGGAERDGRSAGFVSLLFALATLGIVDRAARRLRLGRRAPARHGRRTGSPSSASTTSSALDGLNLFLIAMTALLWVAATAWSLLRDWERPRLYYLMLALGETAVLGAFCAQDLALFVLFFDLMLMPFYFLIGIWGGPDRVRATTTFVIYTLVGSLLMLAAAVATGILATPDGGRARRSSSPTLTQRPLSEGTQEWIFLLLRARVPGEDAGLPAARLDARRVHATRPRPWSRCCRECCRRSAPTASCASRCRCSPTPASQYQELLLVIAVASILYGSVMAFTQTSATLVVGYSSIAQLGFITLGIFSLTRRGRPGRGPADGQPRARGGAAVLHHRAARRARRAARDDLRRMGGLALRAPVLAALFLIVALATLAMPGSANFVGRVPDPDRASSRPRSCSRSSRAPASCWPRST